MQLSLRLTQTTLIYGLFFGFITTAMAAPTASVMPQSSSRPAQNGSAAATKPSAFTHGLTGVNEPLDNFFTHTLWASMLFLCAMILLGRGAQMFFMHLRHVTAMGSDRQIYWTTNNTSLWPKIKRHILYAPFWKKRHNREIQLSSALNFGTLPSRFHTMLLLLYVLSNIAYCSILDYSEPKVALIAEIRGRTGVLAVVNMLPLVVLAGRNNPLIQLLRVSFDTYNLLHRWIGRIVVLEALAHTAAWSANQVMVGGMKSVGPHINSSPFMQWGLVGTSCMIFILISSPSAVRHAFYETFLAFHMLAAFISILGVYMHLKIHHIHQLTITKWVIALWVLDRSARMAWIIYRNISRKGCTTVTVQALGNEACRMTLDLPRPWTPKPGSHAYIYLPRISGLQSHPFSIAWSDEHAVSTSGADNEKLPTTNPALNPPTTRTRTSISLVIHKRTGMTKTLFDRASRSHNGTLTLKGAVEGPYGGLESLRSYGTVVLFAGGIGITHQISHIRDLVAGYAAGTVATRKVVLVWTVRQTEQLEWVRPWMDQILAMPQRRAVLKILLFVTRPRSARELISPSATVQMYPGRPVPQVVLDKEISERVGAMAVTVCGPGSLADSVRHAVRARVEEASVDFVEEAFTW